ncbi:MAG: alpha/beta hydrolase [Candidatus Binatia bacterium]
MKLGSDPIFSPLATMAALVAALVLTVGVAHAADELKRDEASGLQYLEIVTGGAAADDPLPVVVAIHGLGDRPESFRLLLDDLPARARVVVPRAPMPHGADGFSWFEFRASDGGEGEEQLVEGIRLATGRLARLLASLAKRHEGPARTVVCGFSQGGMLSFALASSHPEFVAAAIPVSGYLPSAMWPAERPKTRPLPKILSLHGENDPLISVQWARWTVEALRINGFDANLRSWSGVGHAMVPEVRATLVASVLSAVEELSPAGSVLEGPPMPGKLWLQPRVPIVPRPGEPPVGDSTASPPIEDPMLEDFPPPAPPELAEPSPLDAPVH